MISFGVAAALLIPRIVFICDESGIDFKDLLSKAMSPESSEEEPETLSDKKEVEDKTWQKKTKKLKPQKKQLKKKIQMKSKKD